MWQEALFVWESVAVAKQPPPLSMRDVFLLLDVDMGVWVGGSPTSRSGQEIAHARARRDAIRDWHSRPFVSQPNITIDGWRDGLAWGWAEAPVDARYWRVLMTAEPAMLLADATAVVTAPVSALFQRHRFRGTDVAIFVRDGVDLGRVGEVLPLAMSRFFTPPASDTTTRSE